MSAFTFTVETFLAEERSKLSQERKALQDILHHIENKQQNTTNAQDGGASSHDEILKTEITVQNSALAKNVKTSRYEYENTSPAIATDFSTVNTSQQSSRCDYQIEKQKLVNIFANAPFVLHSKSQNLSKTHHGCKHTRSNRKTRTIANDFEGDKENVPPENVFLNNKPKAMVRYGEFSPLNPDFQSTSKSLVGLGEYEERRRIHLEKKKREYQDYLKTARMKKESQSGQRTNRNHQIDNENENQSLHLPLSLIGGTEMFLAKQDDRRRLIQLQQELYRKELDKQVEEKRKLKEARERQEKQECEMVKEREITCTNNLSNCIQAEFLKRMEKYNEPHSSDERKSNEDIAVSPEHVDVEVPFDKDTRVTSNLSSPILSHSTETCQVDDMEGYRKIQRKLYNEELKMQIQEKRKLDEEQKRRDEEMDEKIKEERLRQEYEQEQAEKAFEIRQKHEHEKRIQENLNQMKNSNQKRSYSKSTAKSNDICRTNLQFNDTIPIKNVSFSPHTYVYDYCADDYHKRCDKMKECPTASIIVNAPYELAIKDVPMTGMNNDLITEPKRPSSPVVPALRTRNLIKAVPKCKQRDIPSGVSMSEKAKASYFRDEKILSCMTEIRRRLRENLPKTTLD